MAAGHCPIGCQTVFSSRKEAISQGLCTSARPRTTRFTLSAARRSSSGASPSAPQRSIALTSMCDARTGASSAGSPVRRLTTPPGTSLVASASASSIAASGRVSDATATTAFPPTSGGRSRVTSPSNGGSSGASTATTPVGSGTVKLKYGPATGFEPPSTCGSLSAQPAYQTIRSIARSTSSRPVLSSANSATRASTISASRYSTWPRLYAVAAAQPGCAARAERTASRTSLREARATFWPSASYVRPDSLRGKAPPMKSLYVFLTGSRSATEGLRLLEVEIRLEPVPAALAAESRLLVAAERRGRVEAVVRVRPHDAGAQALRHPEDARALLRPDAGAQPVRRVVRLLDRLVRRAEGEDGEDGAEDLLLGDPVALRDVGEDGRREPVALLGERARRLVDLRALLLARGDELADLLQLGGGVDRAHVGVLVERVADAQGREAPLQLRDERLVDRLLDEEPRAGAADVALVEVDPVHDPLHGLVERGVVEDDVRGLAAELERQLLAAAGELALDRLPHLGRARERDLVDVLVLDDGRAGAAVAGDDVDHPGRQLGLAQHVAEEQRGERRRLRGLEDDGVPARDGGRDLPGEHQQREVPRDDLAGDADRLRAPVRERVLELVRPAGVVEEVRRRERQVDVARLLDRLAAVQRLEDGELPRALLQDARDPEQVLRALAAGQRRPSVVERVARRRDRALHVGGRRLADLGERLLARGRERRVRLRRLDPLAADEQPVPLAQLHDFARLGRRRVRPAGRHGSALAALRDLSHS